MSELMPEIYQPAEQATPLNLVEGSMIMAENVYNQAAAALDNHKAAWDGELQERQADLRAFEEKADKSLSTAEALQQRLTEAGEQLRDENDLKQSLDLQRLTNQANIEAKQLELDSINNDKDELETEASKTFKSIKEQQNFIDLKTAWMSEPSTSNEEINNKIDHSENYSAAYNTELRTSQDKAKTLGAKLINLIGGRQELLTQMTVTEKATESLIESTKACEQRILALCGEIVKVNNEIDELGQPEIAHQPKEIDNEDGQQNVGDLAEDTEAREFHPTDAGDEVLIAAVPVLAPARMLTMPFLALNEHQAGGKFTGRFSVVGSSHE